MRGVIVGLTAFVIGSGILTASRPPPSDQPEAPDGAGRSSATPDILVSRQLLDSQGLTIGDVVQLSADPTLADTRPFRIVGVYEPVPDPFRFSVQRLEARLHLPDLLELIDDPSDPQSRESVDAISVALHDPADAQEFTRTVSTRVPGLRIRSTIRQDEGNPFVVLERFHLAIAIVTILASTAFLIALMVMRSDERRETAGILRLIGLGKRRVLTQVLFEGLVIAVAGAVFGVGLALVSEGGFNRFFQWRYDTALVFVRISPSVVLRCFALSVPLGVVASVVASWTLLRRDVLALLRR